MMPLTVYMSGYDSSIVTAFSWGGGNFFVENDINRNTICVLVSIIDKVSLQRLPQNAHVIGDSNDKCTLLIHHYLTILLQVAPVVIDTLLYYYRLVVLKRSSITAHVIGDVIRDLQ
jgi:hypothetical protein